MGNRRSSAAILAACLSTASILTAGASAQSLLQTLTGGAPTQRFGASVAFVGDVNGDGISDYAVGAPWPETTSLPFGYQYMKVGYAELRSGADGSLLQHKAGQWLGDQFGACVAAAGDLDGDGVPDWLATSLDSNGFYVDFTIPGPKIQGGGHVRAYSGATGELLDEEQGGLGFLDGLWFEADGAGDVNGDGRGDFIVGHTASLVTFDWSTLTYIYTPVGSASVYSGLTGSPLWVGAGTASGDAFGYSVSRAGDADSDGYADFLVSDLGNETVYLYSGASLTVLRSHPSPAPGSGFGWFVNDIGDLDADGVGDYVVGADGSGLVHAYSGASGLALTPFASPQLGALLGTSAAAAGDVDMDGIVDLAVRGHLTSPPPYYTPYQVAYLISGGSYELRATFAGSLTATGHASGLSGGGDVNLDGRPDLLVGSYDNAVQKGTIEIFSTVPLGLGFYGSGTAGCAGREHLTGDSVPSIDNAGFEIRGDHAPPTSISLVVVSDVLDDGSDPFGIGVTMLVNILQAGELLTLDGASSMTGFTSAPAPIPSVPALVGKTYHAQELRLWPSSHCTPSVLGFSSTAGLTLTIQP